jgi:hypothetical protein
MMAMPHYTLTMSGRMAFIWVIILMGTGFVLGHAWH